MSEGSEREKMTTGVLFDPDARELVEMKRRARRLCRAYNKSAENEVGRRLELVHVLFGRIGRRPSLDAPFLCEFGVNILAGDRIRIQSNCMIMDYARVEIGNNVLIGPGVQINTLDAPEDSAIQSRGKLKARPVTIGDNVFIGGGAIILPGVKIGKGARIGAGSIVTRDVEPDTTVVGNPAKPLGQPFKVSIDVTD